MELLRYRNNRGQVVTVTVEGENPTRGHELASSAHYLAESLGTEVGGDGLAIGGEAEQVTTDPVRYQQAEAAAYLNVHATSQAYGGPEEGGWWYEVGEPVASIPLDHLDVSQRLLLRELVEAAFTTGQSKMKHYYSVNARPGEYHTVTWSDEPAANYPSERPRYE